MDPGARCRIRLEWGIGANEQRVWLLGVQRGRKDAMEQREGGLDEPGDSGGRHSMTNHG